MIYNTVYMVLHVITMCDNDPSSQKEVHKHRSEVGVQKDVYLEQMCKNVQINRVKSLKHRLI